MKKEIDVFKNAVLCLLLISSFYSNLFAQNANFTWAKSFGSSSIDDGWSITNDSIGNSYITGRFTGTVDFDPSPSTFTLGSNGLTDAFVLKLSPQGNLVWAIQIGGIDEEIGRAITLDKANNVIIAGDFKNTVDFDPSAGTFSMTATGGSQEDIFILKLNNSGAFQWAKQISGNNVEKCNSITTDNSGNVYTTGTFNGLTDFDPSPSTFTLTSLGPDAFVLKFSNTGNFSWVKQFTGQASSSSTGKSIKIDATGNVLSTGYFNGTTDFDPSVGTFTLSALGNDEAYISKLDPSGNFIWIKAIGGLSNDQANSITLDQTNNPIITGFFAGTADFDPSAGTNTITSNGAQDIFIVKLNTSGSLVWAKTLGGISPDRGFSITSDRMNNIYSIGHFQATVDFDPGAGVVNFTSPGGDNDIYISKLDASGNFMWAKQIGNNQDDTGWGISLDANGNVYSTGYFNSTVDFDPSPSTFTLTSGGVSDVFVHKLSCAAPSLSVSSTSNTICVGETATLTVSGASSYTWNTTSTLTSIPVSPTINTSYSVTGIDTHGCSNSSSFSQVVSPCTGINEQQSVNSIKIFPNPSVGKFTFEFEAIQSKTAIEVYDNLGKIIYKSVINNIDKVTIDISDHSKGIYYYSLKPSSLNPINGKIILD